MCACFKINFSGRELGSAASILICDHCRLWSYNLSGRIHMCILLLFIIIIIVIIIVIPSGGVSRLGHEWAWLWTATWIFETHSKCTTY